LLNRFHDQGRSALDRGSCLSCCRDPGTDNGI
jgi:hypothetical protein